MSHRASAERVNRLVRNFCIIAHIDHGKTTLSDRLLELTGTLAKREMQEQVLDSMDLERERGITIKAHPVTLEYGARDGELYELNLIDTPGHVDFSYEVSRSLSACEGALLVIDASQGIEAQTLANFYLASEAKLEIIPVINKIDLPSANPDGVARDVEDTLLIEADKAIKASAKEGIGIEEILEAIVTQVPPPKGSEDHLRALVFDSHYDAYRGVIAYVRVFDGTLRSGTRIRSMAGDLVFEVLEVGTFRPEMRAGDHLGIGDVGYVIANIKSLSEIAVGDTLTDADRPAHVPLPGYRKVTPMVYCGLYANEGSEYGDLRDALEKLKLNDASLSYEPESSIALGFGFRCGFLGLLHMEIVQERLEREYGVGLIATSPSVVYHVNTTSGEKLIIDNPANLPPQPKVATIEEPYVRCSIIAPAEYIGTIMDLCQTHRGTMISMDYISPQRVIFSYEIPLAEVIIDFFDQLKSRTKGYASMDYEVVGFRPGDLVKLEILLNAEAVDALSFIIHRDKAAHWGRMLAERLREVIPRQMFDVPIQAAIGGKIIARETVKAMRKNVLAKCYGGDITRKRKLLEKQKEGKKRMKQVGSVELPQEAFMAVLRLRDE
ncbi:MAG: elongation factor 4 [Candidatus Eremiobacteraeota bacterium]|nr:elongation factor 4 [Candidatus Eremiobacteraeota bacterium]